VCDWLTGHTRKLIRVAALRPDVFSVRHHAQSSGPETRGSRLRNGPKVTNITEFVKAHREFTDAERPECHRPTSPSKRSAGVLMGLIKHRIGPGSEKERPEGEREAELILPDGLTRPAPQRPALDYLPCPSATASHGRLRAKPYTFLSSPTCWGARGRPRDLLDAAAMRQIPGHPARRHVTEHKRTASTSGHNKLEVFTITFCERSPPSAGCAAAQRRLTGMAQGAVTRRPRPRQIRGAQDRVPNLFAAGQETTVRMIATALRRIAMEPEEGKETRRQPMRMRANRDLVPRFVEEETCAPRARSSAEYRLWRIKTTELGGSTIPAGTQIFLCRTEPATATRASSRHRPSKSSGRPGRRERARHIELSATDGCAHLPGRSRSDRSEKTAHHDREADSTRTADHHASSSTKRRTARGQPPPTTT